MKNTLATRPGTHRFQWSFGSLCLLGFCLLGFGCSNGKSECDPAESDCSTHADDPAQDDDGSVDSLAFPTRYLVDYVRVYEPL